VPDWGKVLKEIAEAVAASAIDPRITGRPRQSLGRIRFGVSEPNRCLFWDCGQAIRPDHVFCYEHFRDFQEGLVDECPGCGRAKDAVYDWCLDCYRQSSSSQRAAYQSSRVEQKRWYRPEYSAAWDNRDATADRFFVYILKFANGAFYAGQTRELRERLSEHRDGKAKTTAGQTPKLVWFGIVKSREAATSMEVELKKLIDSNPREIRRMIISFQDLVKELDYT